MQNAILPLTPELQRSLLQAIRPNQLDLTPFVALFAPTVRQPTHDLSCLSECEKSRLTELVAKAGSKTGIMPITSRPVKARLLQAIAQQQLRPDDFPEIREACQRLQPDLSVFSPEERNFLFKLAIKTG